MYFIGVLYLPSMYSLNSSTPPFCPDHFFHHFCLSPCLLDHLHEVERLKKECLTQSDNLAVTLTMRRNYTVPVAPGVFEIDPRFLLFEFCHGLLLRPSQVQLVNKLLTEMELGHSVCHQMIMGAGKTTVVGPLLTMLLANANTLVVEVVPPALLDFSAGVLRERFSAAIRKPVFTFTFDRYSKVTHQLLAKVRSTRCRVVLSVVNRHGTLYFSHASLN